MKKLLALVLALVMTLGLATVGANAATYSDADDIKYEEAADVMTAIGVFSGADGKFNPTGTLTREQGAKIISYMLLGKTAGDALNVTTAPFTDVAADRWSAGSIAYAKSLGIIDGVGDGKFDPEAPLTGAAFAKMLLTALGYSAKREGLTGTDYILNTTRLVNKIDLANGLGGLSYTGTITRDEASKLAFNTLTKDMVEYVGGMDIVAGDVSVSQNVLATSVDNIAYSYLSSAADGTGTAAANGTTEGGTVAGTGKMQFCENYFPNLKVATGTDAFGVQTNFWFLADKRDDYDFDKAEDDAIVADAAGSTVTEYTKTSTLTYGDLYKLGEYAAAVNILENGEDIGGSAADDLTVGSVTKGSATKVSTNVAGIVNWDGALTRVLDNNGDGKIDTISVMYGYLAKVTKVNAATASKDRSIELDVYSKADAGTVSYTGANAFETEEFEKGDYVIAYPNEKWGALTATKGIIKVEPVEKISGETTAYGGTSNSAYTALTVAGTSYDVSAAAQTLGTVTVASTGRTTVDAYMLNGYILGTVVTSGLTTADMSDIVYVLAIANTGADPSTGKSTNYVPVLHMDGTYEVIKSTNALTVTAGSFYTLGSTSGQPTLTAAADGVTDNKLTTDMSDISSANHIYYATGTLNGGTVNLTPTTKSVQFDETAAGETNVKTYLTANTAYIFINTDTNKTSITTGGITRAAAAPTGILVNKNSTDGSYEVAAMIFAASGAGYSESVSSDVVFVSSTTKKGVSGSKNVFQGYDLEGSKVDVVAASDPTAVGFYSYTKDADGIWTLATVDAGTTSVTKGAYQNIQNAVATSYHGDLLTVGTEIVDLASSDAVIVNLDSTPVTAGSPVNSISGIAGLTTVTAAVYAVDNAAKMIVVLSENSTAPTFTAVAIAKAAAPNDTLDAAPDAGGADGTTTAKAWKLVSADAAAATDKAVITITSAGNKIQSISVETGAGFTAEKTGDLEITLTMTNNSVADKLLTVTLVAADGYTTTTAQYHVTTAAA